LRAASYAYTSATQTWKTPSWVTDTLGAADEALRSGSTEKSYLEWDRMLAHFLESSRGSARGQFPDTTSQLASKITTALERDTSLSAPLKFLPFAFSLVPLFNSQKTQDTRAHQPAITEMIKRTQERLVMLMGDGEEHGTKLAHQFVHMWAVNRPWLDFLRISCQGFAFHQRSRNHGLQEMLQSSDFFILSWICALGVSIIDVLVVAPQSRQLSEKASVDEALEILFRAWEGVARPKLSASVLITPGIYGRTDFPSRSQFPLYRLYLCAVINVARAIFVSAHPLQPFFKTAGVLIKKAVELEPRGITGHLRSQWLHDLAFSFVGDVLKPKCVLVALSQDKENSQLILELVKFTLIVEGHVTLGTVQRCKELLEAAPLYARDLTNAAAEAIVLTFKPVEVEEAWEKLHKGVGDENMSNALGHVLCEAVKIHGAVNQISASMFTGLEVPRMATAAFLEWLKQQAHLCASRRLEQAREIAFVIDCNSSLFSIEVDDPLLVLTKGALQNVRTGGSGNVADELANAIFVIAQITTASAGKYEGGRRDIAGMSKEFVKMISRHVPSKPCHWFGSIVGTLKSIEEGWHADKEPVSSLLPHACFSSALAVAVGSGKPGLSCEQLTDELISHLSAAATQRGFGRNAVRQVCFAEAEFLRGKIQVLHESFTTATVSSVDLGIPKQLVMLLQLCRSVSMPAEAGAALRAVEKEARRRVETIISTQSSARTLRMLLVKNVQGTYEYAPYSTERWLDMVAALNAFSERKWSQVDVKREVEAILRRAEAEIERNQEAGSAYRFLASQNALGRGMANLELRKDQALTMSVDELKHHNDDQTAAFRDLDRDAFKTLTKLGRPGTMFERAFTRKLREHHGDRNVLSKAILEAKELLKKMVLDDDDSMDIEAFSAQLSDDAADGGAVADILESRGIGEIVKDFDNMSRFFEEAVHSKSSARERNFATKVENFKATVPLLQYRMHVEKMVLALVDLGAITDVEARNISPATKIVSENFKLAEAQKILENVRRVLTANYNGQDLALSPIMCEMLSTLQRADVVVSSLKSAHLLDNDSFQRAMTKAQMHASTDESALERLNQLYYLRALVEPWLNAPVPFNVVMCNVFEQLDKTEEVKVAVDKSSARDVAATRLINLIENCCRSWQHTFSFFDGKNDAIAASELIKQVPVYMQTGRYFGRLPEQARYGSATLMFKYQTLGDQGSEIELQPDILLEQARFAVLSCSRAPDEDTKLALEKFKESYASAVKLLRARQELAEAGHPMYQVPGFVELADSAEPGLLNEQIQLVRTKLDAWKRFVSDTIDTEPRLRLLTPMNRLSALSAILKCGENDDVQIRVVELVRVLEVYVLQAFPESVKFRSDLADILMQVCGKVAGNSFGQSADFAMGLFVDLVHEVGHQLAAPPMNGKIENVVVGPRVGELGRVVHVVELPAAGAVGVASLDHAAYKAQLELVCAASPNGVAPSQVLWCHAGMPEAEVTEWAQLTVVPGVVEAAAAMNVDRLRGPARQTLAAFFVNTGGRAACDVYLIFGGNLGMRAFSSFSRHDEPLHGNLRVHDAMLALRSPQDARNTSACVIDAVQVVVGGPRSGKSCYIGSLLRGSHATVKVPVHEGFQVRSAIRQYNRVLKTAGSSGEDVIGFHIDLYDVQGVDMLSLAKFLHVLMSTGMLVDGDNGESLLLATNVRHRIFVELPALCALSSRDDRGSRRAAWPPVSDTAWSAKNHPYLQQLGPLLLLPPDSFKNINPVTWPLQIDAAASQLASCLRFSNQRGTDKVPVFFEGEGLAQGADWGPFWEERSADATTHDADRAEIVAAIDEVLQGLPMSVGSRAAVVRCVAMSLPVMEDLVEEVARPSDGNVSGIKVWATPFNEFGRNLQDLNLQAMSREAYMPNFFKLFVKILVHEAVQMLARSSPFSIWSVFLI